MPCFWEDHLTWPPRRLYKGFPWFSLTDTTVVFGLTATVRPMISETLASKEKGWRLEKTKRPWDQPSAKHQLISPFLQRSQFLRQGSRARKVRNKLTSFVCHCSFVDRWSKMLHVNARQSAMLLQHLSRAVITTVRLQMKRHAQEKVQDGKQHEEQIQSFHFFLDYMLFY